MNSFSRIGLVGFGNIGSACAEAIADKPGFRVLVYDQKKSKLKAAKATIKAKSLEEVIRKSKIIILAIKPQDLDFFLAQGQKLILKYKPLLVSLMAGVSLDLIQRKLPQVKVARAMPNLAIKVKEGLVFISRGTQIKGADLKKLKKIFSLMGQVVEVKETFMDKVTALIGSGPGFIFYLMDIFYQQISQLGFRPKAAKEITCQLFFGSASLASNSKKSFRQLLADVASAKGTTAAGISFFKKVGLEKRVVGGIEAASKRAEKIAAEVGRKKL